MTDVTLRAFVEGKVSRQQFLDFAYAKLKEQGGVSKRGSGCMYNAPDGRHCAIGWTILNETKYRPPEGKSVPVIIKDLGLQNNMAADDLAFLGSVQRAHDNIDERFDFQVRLREAFAALAKMYRLVPPK